jgi:5-methylcytosine-specific restriction endonuclease McrA
VCKNTSVSTQVPVPVPVPTSPSPINDAVSQSDLIAKLQQLLAKIMVVDEEKANLQQLLTKIAVIEEENKKLRQQLLNIGSENNQVQSKPNKKQNIPQVLRLSVWLLYAKKTGKCYCCGINEIEALNFTAGHIIPESKGGQTTILNLRPICGPCNSSVWNHNMIDFAKQYFPNSPLLKETDTN